MKKIITLFAFILAFNALAQKRTNVYIDLEQTAKKDVSPYIYGGFTEYLRDFVNGPLGETV